MAKKASSRSSIETASVGRSDNRLEPADSGAALSWLRRQQARVSIPKPRILEDVPSQSDPTGDQANLVIEGDNRQAMVSLLLQYAGLIDVVLTDHPVSPGTSMTRSSSGLMATASFSGEMCCAD